MLLVITGGMRTTTSDVMDAHANLPFHLLINKVCYRATARMCTLPDSHPLHPAHQARARALCALAQIEPTGVRHTLPPSPLQMSKQSDRFDTLPAGSHRTTL